MCANTPRLTLTLTLIIALTLALILTLTLTLAPLQVVPAALSPAEEERVESLFNAVDKDQSGALEKAEVA